MEMIKQINVSIRWIDGYFESFECVKIRFGGELIYMELEQTNRHIPLTSVRWFSVLPHYLEKK